MSYRGVNLGGWLILERWITPSLFEGLQARDEYSYCQELGDNAAETLASHRSSFITEQDIAWLAEHGINAIRVPLPHWVFGDDIPYVSCEAYVDWLLPVAERYGLKVLLDLHTAPHSQNGQDHSGRTGEIGWHKAADNMVSTHEVLERVARKWGTHPSVLGLELLNEPDRNIDHELLLSFYRQSVERLRPLMGDKLLVVSDAFRPRDWNGLGSGVVLDMHLYQAFDKPNRPDKIIKKARVEWGDLINDVQAHRPVIVGEWSLGLDPKVFRGLDDFGRDKALQAFGAAQEEAFGHSLGYFFWTYKTETMPGWSYETCIKRGWLPPGLLQ